MRQCFIFDLLLFNTTLKQFGGTRGSTKLRFHYYEFGSLHFQQKPSLHLGLLIVFVNDRFVFGKNDRF